MLLHNIRYDAEPVEYFGNQKVRLIFQDIAKNIPVQKLSEFDAIAIDIYINAIQAVIKDGETIDTAYNNAKEEILSQLN